MSLYIAAEDGILMVLIKDIISIQIVTEHNSQSVGVPKEVLGLDLPHHKKE